jgi:hypothetical protein
MRSASDGSSFDIHVLSFDLAPTLRARVGVAAASRIASATCFGSSIGSGNRGSCSM